MSLTLSACKGLDEAMGAELDKSFDVIPVQVFGAMNEHNIDVPSFTTIVTVISLMSPC